jgi:diaminopimelate epimerase
MAHPNPMTMSPSDTTQALRELADKAVAICDRHTGAGADGWMLMQAPEAAGADYHAAIHLFNSDGSESEISGNGTRCAAALLVREEHAGEEVRILTGAGLKTLRLMGVRGLEYQFEMNMGRPAEHDAAALQFALPFSAGEVVGSVLNVGNPQFAVQAEHLDFDWRSLGAEIERHPQFPHRTNVSFYRVIDEHNLEVRFWERGAGETMSSGTGSTGAVAAAVLRGLAVSPVTVHTPAGPLALRWQDDIYLTGPAQIVAAGEFYYQV